MTGRRNDEALAKLVERAFSTDPAAIARGRAHVASQGRAAVPAASPARRSLRLGRSILGAGALTAAGLLLVFTIAGRNAPAPLGGLGPTTPSATAAIAASIEQSSSDLDAVLVAAQSGNSANLAVLLAAYQADLTTIAGGLDQPGTDRVAARTNLEVERTKLERAFELASAGDKGLVAGLQAKLDGLIAELGVAPTGGPGHGNGGSPGTGGNGNGSGSGSGSGNGGGSGGNGNGGAGGPGSGNRGGASSGNNGKGHPKVK